MIGLSHPILAYCFDEAVFYFGNHIEGKLSERKPDGKPKYSLARLLGVQPQAHKLTAAEVAAMFGG